MTILNRLFGFSSPVNRKTYFTTGVILMAVKYAWEFLMNYFLLGIVLMPWGFVNPAMKNLGQVGPHGGRADLFLLAFLLWSIPFIWIGLSMSVRRAENAGLSPWWGTLFFVPVLNLGLMAVFCLIPERPDAPAPQRDTIVFSGFVWAVGSAIAICALLSILWVSLLGQYGTGLFVGAPLLAGLTGGYVMNRKKQYSCEQTLWTMLFAILFAAGIFLLVAWEGAICLLMAAPIVLGLAMPASLFGRFLANRRKHGLLSLSPALLMIPGFFGYDLLSHERPLYEVYSSVEIAASPEKIWPIVIAFPELAPPTEAIFKAGIAYPIRAHIDGTGVGAVRYCEFSTGPFVEPITAWEPGERLAFSVSSNPKPMTELNPFWKEVDAPHLHGFMESEKGEFRFVKLSDGKTRLEGRTWYRQGIFPQVYWSRFSNEIIHRIHLRVLSHIKALAERQS
ncbi:MAG: DUF805 domain-containing protein [Bdellovibrionota bacterium]